MPFKIKVYYKGKFTKIYLNNIKGYLLYLIK